MLKIDGLFILNSIKVGQRTPRVTTVTTTTKIIAPAMALLEGEEGPLLTRLPVRLIHITAHTHASR